jgi:hypothetical protein
MDSRHLDDEIQDLLSVEPSPEFLARVRTSIAAASIASPIPRFLAGLGGITAVAVLVVAIAVSWPGKPEQPTVAAPPAPPAAVSSEMPASAVQTNSPVATSVERARTRTATTLASRTSDFPEVMLSPDDVRSLQEVLVSAGARRFEVSPEGVQALMDTSIPEIVIAPVNVFMSDQGAQQ